MRVNVVNAGYEAGYGPRGGREERVLNIVDKTVRVGCVRLMSGMLISLGYSPRVGDTLTHPFHCWSVLQTVFVRHGNAERGSYTGR